MAVARRGLGANCSGAAAEQRVCGMGGCPVDCEYEAGLEGCWTRFGRHVGSERGAKPHGSYWISTFGALGGMLSIESNVARIGANGPPARHFVQGPMRGLSASRWAGEWAGVEQLSGRQLWAVWPVVI